ncbi:hypothetical protein QR680_017930 [Steinernema hermaphroditum]|uniref:Uncharacterized protein n=1 Tax=Steinernema hermaphroditum TaxID=289476 RepID=A0AA39HGB9_9BILA|nr:hypothetical protein QR680_017930 [Steinernema hermaphroditum]
MQIAKYEPNNLVVSEDAKGVVDSPTQEQGTKKETIGKKPTHSKPEGHKAHPQGKGSKPERRTATSEGPTGRPRERSILIEELHNSSQVVLDVPAESFLRHSLPPSARRSPSPSPSPSSSPVPPTQKPEEKKEEDKKSCCLM